MSNAYTYLAIFVIMQTTQFNSQYFLILICYLITPLLSMAESLGSGFSNSWCFEYSTFCMDSIFGFRSSYIFDSIAADKRLLLWICVQHIKISSTYIIDIFVFPNFRFIIRDKSCLSNHQSIILNVIFYLFSFFWFCMFCAYL